MKNSTKLLLSTCTVALAAGVGAVPSFAQDAGPTEQVSEDSASNDDAGSENVIIVSGIRASLDEASAIKREAIGVVDAISAEDIGKFPDANLAESLQRIAGVSIDRSNNEGNGVTVRGFGPDFNLVTLNGRQMPTSSSLVSEGIGRSFNFRDLASESVSAVEVFKSGRADLVSGGLGATINIRTPRPLDNPGIRGVISAKALYDTSNEVGADITPEIAGLFSATFGPEDRIGILVTGSFSERNSRRERAGTQGWVRNRGDRANPDLDLSAIDTSRNPDAAFWTPWTVDLDTWDSNRERINGQVVLQAEPVDGLTFTADYTMSRYEEVTRMNRMSFWFDQPDIATADANGTLVDITTLTDELNFWAWEFLNDTSNDAFGGNIEWEVTDNLTLEFDAHTAKSHSNPDTASGQAAETLANLRNPLGSIDFINGNFTGALPTANFDDTSIPGSGYDFSNIVSDLYQKRGYEVENRINQFQFDGSWSSDGAISAVNFGASFTDYKVDTLLSSTFRFVDVPLNGLSFGYNDRGDTLSAFSGADQLFSQIPEYSAVEFVDLVEANGQFAIDPPSLNGVREETLAAYVSVDLDSDFNGMPLRVNAGVRYEDTDVAAFSIQNGIVGLNFRNTQELQVVRDDSPTENVLEGGYSVFLPNLSASLEVTPDVVVRAAYSRTIARSSLSAMFPNTSFLNSRPGGPFIVSQGNPDLLPYTADNLDLSLEWYYSPSSYIAVGAFKKFVDNFIGATSTSGPISDVNGQPLRDPSANPRAGCPDPSEPPNPACLSQAGDPIIDWEIRTTGNLRSASVQGLEATVQHVFGDTGFGVILNGTLVDGNLNLDPFDFSQTLALTGLSNSYNIVGFYEKNGLQARVAYNWRDEFLLALGTEPTNVEAYGQLDASISYDVTDNITVFGEALNITNETTRRFARFQEQVIDADQFGTRFAFGVRASF